MTADKSCVGFYFNRPTTLPQTQSQCLDAFHNVLPWEISTLLTISNIKW